MSLDGVTIGELKELGFQVGTGSSGSPECPFTVGDKVFVRTVTHYLTGRVVRIQGKYMWLADGAWIAETDRFHKTIRDGVFREVEPIVGEWMVNCDTIVDGGIWHHQLPMSVKP